ncbi:MAG: hypothetical protein U9N42_02720 [Campylobacterota bacterium]|nr:hypothetical protein [Campylobacterota bacterium]
MIENYLQQLDKALEQKSAKDLYIIYFMIVGVFGFISYNYFFDSSEQGYKRSVKEAQQLKSKIKSDKSYLVINNENTILALTKNIEQMKKDFIYYEDSNAYIKTQIKQISVLYYDEKRWGVYLDSIPTNAKKFRVKINELTNTFSDNKETFGHVLDISINANGSFKNQLKFINSLEESFLVVDIHDLNLKESNKTINSDMNISVWGIIQ